jgi:hypothetical protein
MNVGIRSSLGMLCVSPRTIMHEGVHRQDSAIVPDVPASEATGASPFRTKAANLLEG